MALRFDVITIFPGMFTGVLDDSIVARARRAGLVDIGFTDPREFATDRHRSVDDRPYGGGPGMVFKPEPVFAAVESLLAAPKAPPEKTRTPETPVTPPAESKTTTPPAGPPFGATPHVLVRCWIHPA